MPGYALDGLWTVQGGIGGVKGRLTDEVVGNTSGGGWHVGMGLLERLSFASECEVFFEVLTLPNRGEEQHLVPQQQLQCAAEQAAQMSVIQQPLGPVHVANQTRVGILTLSWPLLGLNTELRCLDDAAPRCMRRSTHLDVQTAPAGSQPLKIAHDCPTAGILGQSWDSRGLAAVHQTAQALQ